MIVQHEQHVQHVQRVQHAPQQVHLSLISSKHFMHL